MNIAVIGLGNVLLGDDGFGPYVVELLRRRYAFPPGVELLDLGTPGLGLISYLHGHDAVVFVDAVSDEAPPGTLRVYEDTELARMRTGPRVSPHDPALAEALDAARAAGGGPRTACLVGAVPASSEPGAQLTTPVRAAAEWAATIVRQRVEAQGFDVRRCGDAELEPDWWCRRRDCEVDPCGFSFGRAGSAG